IRALREARPAAPDGFAERVAAALAGTPPERAADPGRRGRWRAWAGSAAAVLVLAFGARLALDDSPEPTTLGLDADPSVWIADDGIVAGAPVLDELPEEQLLALL